MFSLIVLFTVFLGLIGVLALLGRWQRKWVGLSGSHDPDVNYRYLTAWLESRGDTLPTVATVIRLLNKVALREIKSEDWRELEIAHLYPATELPVFSVQRIDRQTDECLEFKVGIDWPMCLPGVCVSLKREEGEEHVSCDLQVDWMYAEGIVRLMRTSQGLLLGYKHSLRPQMAISCLVTTPEVEESERLASSVAHALQLMFYQMELKGERLGTEEGEKPEAAPVANSLPSALPKADQLPNNVGHHPHSEAEHGEDSPHQYLTPAPAPSSSTSSRVGKEEEEEVEVEEEEEEEEEGKREGEEEVPTPQVAVVVETAQPSSKQGSPIMSPQPEEKEKEQEVEEKEERDKVKDVEKKEEEEEEGKDEEGRRAVGPGTNQVSPHVARESTQAKEVGTEQVQEYVLPTPMFTVPHTLETPPTVTCQKRSSPPSPLAITRHSAENTAFHRSKSMSSWRRSPSYEQLQEFALPSVQEDETGENGVVGKEGRRGGGGRDDLAHPQLLNQRQALTLSMSGSAISVESKDDEPYPSTLVFEIADSERIRHIVALSKAHASKLRKRVAHARKLHIYNNHIFVATHLKQRFYCHVCKQKITGFVGKQGYACRDCHMVVHKHCHCKVENICIHSKLPSMNLIYPDSVSTISGL